MDDYSCLHCLSEKCVALRLDKKGRPYTYCRVCSTRSFMPTSIALRGLMLFAPQILEVLKRSGQLNRDRLDQQGAAVLAEKKVQAANG